MIAYLARSCVLISSVSDAWNRVNFAYQFSRHNKIVSLVDSSGCHNKPVYLGFDQLQNLILAMCILFMCHMGVVHSQMKLSLIFEAWLMAMSK